MIRKIGKIFSNDWLIFDEDTIKEKDIFKNI